MPPGTDAKNAPIGKLKRAFGHDPATVSSHVAAFIAGMQDAGVATTVKHFPGLGRVAGNTDFKAGVVDTITTADDPYLEPFATAIDAGVPFVMVSLATYDQIDPAHVAAFSPTIIGDMLRGQLGFRGVVISDALGAKAVTSIPPATRALAFLGAGGDMIISNQVPSAIEMAQAIAYASRRGAGLRGTHRRCRTPRPAGEGGTRPPALPRLIRPAMPPPLNDLRGHAARRHRRPRR